MSRITVQVFTIFYNKRKTRNVAEHYANEGHKGGRSVSDESGSEFPRMTTALLGHVDFSLVLSKVNLLPSGMEVEGGVALSLTVIAYDER